MTAAARSHQRRLPDWPASAGWASLDILFTLFGDQPGRAECEHQQEQREADGTGQARMHELGREAFDQTDHEPCDDRPLDVAEPADDDDGESLHDYARAGKGR